MIRPCTTLDFNDSLLLFQELWPERGLNKQQMKVVFRKYLNDANYRIYCFEGKSHLIGLITLSIRFAFFYEGRIAILEDVIVHKDFRGQGIGTRLIREMEKIMSEEGIRGIELHSDFQRLKTHRFLEGLGYTSLAFQFRKDLKTKQTSPYIDLGV